MKNFFSPLCIFLALQACSTNIPSQIVDQNPKAASAEIVKPNPDELVAPDQQWQKSVAENAALIALIESMQSGGYVMYMPLLATVPPMIEAPHEGAWWKDCVAMPSLKPESIRTLNLIGYAMMRIGPVFREVRMGETCAALDAAVGLNLPYSALQRPALNPPDVLLALGQTETTIAERMHNEFTQAVKGGGNILILGYKLPKNIAAHPSATTLSEGEAAVFQIKGNEIAFVRTIDPNLWMPYAKRAAAGVNLPRAASPVQPPLTIPEPNSKSD